ncbi:MAG: hypothetical protein IT304_12060 [Dehalococcoidia bacterium]|nr:hypothetical protein [Dehalococcoidia bacterium]
MLRWWSPGLALALLLGGGAACGGGGAKGPPPNIAEAAASRDLSGDGAALLTTTVTVRFDRDFTVVEKQLPLASLFELQVPKATGNGSDRVLVQEATKDDVLARTIVLKVNRLVPEGATLTVANRAFRKGDTSRLSIAVKSDLTAAEVILASAALAITRPELVPDASVPPVSTQDRDPVAMRSALEKALDQRGASAAVKKAALDRYDQVPAAIVPSPKARAALAALVGTFAEPALDYLLTANNCTGKPAALVAFQPPPDAPRLLARVTFNEDGRRIVSLNPITEGERIEHLMPLLAHEAIHCDRIAGRYEEIAATAFDSFLYMNLLAAQPDLAEAGTTLARDLNVDAVALINSGRRLPESIGLLPSPAVRQAVPGTTSNAQSFADFVAAAYPGVDTNTSPDEPLAQLYAAALAKIAGLQEGSAFDLRYLDELLARAIDPAVLFAVVANFGLQPVGG